MTVRNKQWLLTSRPTGAVTESNFKLAETEMPALQDGQIGRAHV